MFIEHMKEESKIIYEKFEENNEIKLEVIDLKTYEFKHSFGKFGYRIDGRLNVLGDKIDLTAFYLPVPYKAMSDIWYEHIRHFCHYKCEPMQQKIPEKRKLRDGGINYDLKDIKKYINTFTVFINDHFDIEYKHDEISDVLSSYISLMLYNEKIIKESFYNLEWPESTIPFLNSFITYDPQYAALLMAKPMVYLNMSNNFLKRIEEKILDYYSDKHDYCCGADYTEELYNFIKNNKKFQDIEIKQKYLKDVTNEHLYNRNKRQKRICSEYDYLQFRIRHIDYFETILKMVSNEDKIEKEKDNFKNKLIDL